MERESDKGVLRTVLERRRDLAIMQAMGRSKDRRSGIRTRIHFDSRSEEEKSMWLGCSRRSVLHLMMLFGFNNCTTAFPYFLSYLFAFIIFVLSPIFSELGNSVAYA